jgi:eukaryotic-like serine/threonine-protein kinase
VFRDSTPLRAGQKLGRYELLAPVARGGMGQVWAGRLRGARGFHKLVAIKTLLPSAGETAHMEQRLLDEARIAALIQHSNVAQTLELGEHEGTLYLVMEWVDGEPLSDVMLAAQQAGGIPHLVAVNLVAQTLRGLQAAHDLSDEAGISLGVVHRDVSPNNVLVSYSGIAKLVDFGIAKSMNQRTSFRDGELEGKLSYMAPEQVLGSAVDKRADLFAVGVMLYVLTTGRHPFANEDSAEVLRNIVSEEPAVRPSLLKPNYSRTLEAVAMKALEKDRDRRWPSAEEMRLALQRGVPQAFELGFEAQLRNFMGDTVGDRAVRKRDALRRAELAVDAQLGVPPSASPASSVSSLRAISVDTSWRKEDSVRPRDKDSVRPRNSLLPTLRPLLPTPAPTTSLKPRRRALRPVLLGAAAAAAALVFGLVWLRPTDGTTQAATSPGSGMVDLSPPRAASVAVPPVASLAPSAAASTLRPSLRHH